MLVEHVIEQASWAAELDAMLQAFDVFRVGVHAPMALLEQRERARGDRALGEAREHLSTHSHCTYHLEVETIGSPDAVAMTVVDAWERRHG
jgi:chloramphenicol 3-O phosphotransferase